MSPMLFILFCLFRNQQKAVTDLSTGDIMYLIDDNGGSEIYLNDLIALFVLIEHLAFFLRIIGKRRKQSIHILTIINLKLRN